MSKYKRSGLISAFVLIAMALTITVYAAPLAASINRQSIGSGGSRITNGNGIVVNATAGQALIGAASDGTIAIKSGYWGGGYGPTAVTMDTFAAQSLPHSIKLIWKTVIEIDLNGFVIYRSTTPNGLFTPISDLLPAQGFGSGSDYHWYDQTVVPGTRYYYALKAVHFSDDPAWYRTEAVASIPIFLPVIRK